jgi:hypothetical protein
MTGGAPADFSRELYTAAGAARARKCTAALGEEEGRKARRQEGKKRRNAGTQKQQKRRKAGRQTGRNAKPTTRSLNALRRARRYGLSTVLKPIA